MAGRRQTFAVTKKNAFRPTPDGGRSCAFRANLGRKVKGIPTSGPYSVCLSKNQVRELFGHPPAGKPIGCGTFACVWQGKSSDRVVKLTSDRDDVEGLRAAQGLERVVKVFESRRLVDAGRSAKDGKPVQVYAIVAERLSPLSRADQKKIDRPLERARMVMLKRAEKHRGKKENFKPPTGKEREALVHKICTKGRDKSFKNCPRFIDSFFDGWTAMFRRGVLWQDAHPGNVAVDAQGRWKAIDLGFSGTRKRSNIPALAGARPRRRR